MARQNEFAGNDWRDAKARRVPEVAVSCDLLGGGAGLELLIGYTRLGNLLALLDREEVPEIHKHLFGTVCLTPCKHSGPPLRAFADASRRRGVDGRSRKLVRFVPEGEVEFKPGEAAVHWPIRYSTPKNLYPVQPTAGEACSLQPAHQIGHFAGSLPDDPGLVIGDHAQDRPLVNAEIITINPAYAPINSASFKADMGITEAGAE